MHIGTGHGVYVLPDREPTLDTGKWPKPIYMVRYPADQNLGLSQHVQRLCIKPTAHTPQCYPSYMGFLPS